MRKLLLLLTLLAALLTCAAPALATPGGAVLDARYMTVSQIRPGDEVLYGVSVVNVGTESTTGPPTWVVTVPSGVTVYSAPGCDQAGDVITCENWKPSLAPGEATSFTLTLRVPSDIPLGKATFVNELSADGAPSLPTREETMDVRAASSPFGITSFDGRTLAADGSDDSQAGGHPYAVTTDVRLSTRTNDDGETIPSGNLRSVTLDLPAGFMGDPRTLPVCHEEQLRTQGWWFVSSCPAETQIGVVELGVNGAAPWSLPLFNVEPSDDQPARFGFSPAFPTVHAEASVRSSSDYGVTVEVADIEQFAAIFGTRITLWGVPQDPGHDTLRQRCGFIHAGEADGQGCPLPATEPRKPFISYPTACTPAGKGLVTRVRVTSWEGDSASSSFESHDAAGAPLGVTGCDRVPFDASAAVKPTTSAAGTPTGLDVELTVPQSQDPDGIASSHVKRVEVQLPEGMTVSPSSAGGLGACSPAQIGIGEDRAPACPPDSKIGDVTIESPVLEHPLKGGVFLATQGQNPFGSLLALYVVAQGQGVTIKLPGKVVTDPTTGRVSTVFDDNPQLPFGKLTLHLKDGPRAPLTTPATCGEHQIVTTLTPWSGGAPRTSTSTFAVECPGATGFAPSFAAGTSNARSGAFASFAMSVARGDGEQPLAGLDVTLPKGLLAMVGDVPLCAEAQAAAGTCPAASQVGHVQVAAGSGSSPIWVPGAGRTPTSVSLAGPYKGAPYSLSIVVPAQAGPFDLGTTVVRAALHVDPKDAHVTVKSDPLPTILEGIPLQVREVRVQVDRDRFMFNPTNCAAMQVSAAVRGLGGASANLAARYQADRCAALAFSPVIQVQGGGKGNTARFTHPSLTVKVRQAAGQARLDKTNVVLPRAFNVDLQAPALKAACPREVYAQDKCSTTAIVGQVKAVTPVFKEPLTGPAFLLQKKGQLPDIVMRLRNAHYAIDLIGVLDFLNDGRVITRVSGIPDAPISTFELTIKGGRNGSLLTRSSLCTKAAATQATFKGQNGKLSVKTPTTRISGCPAKRTARKRAARTEAGR